mmetsp:Transcript_73886/g.161694  ORF Transcript_73886/g.161694 Transcript_73886/m.161694 type:complete len:929 (-) Transcript_73886:49-2835(-)
MEPHYKRARLDGAGIDAFAASFVPGYGQTLGWAGHGHPEQAPPVRTPRPPPPRRYSHQHGGGGYPDAAPPHAHPFEQEDLHETFEDEVQDERARISRPITFIPEDTTLNILQSTSTPGLLAPLAEGGLQCLVGGARANVGQKAGRYAFEVKVLNAIQQPPITTANARPVLTKPMLRIGFSLGGVMPIMGDYEDSICFDLEGHFLWGKQRTHACQPLGYDGIFTVVLDLTIDIRRLSSISLFKNGKRVTSPQTIPDALKGQVLYPTVCFRNMDIYTNFGPQSFAPLSFTCRMLQAASEEDVEVIQYQPPSDGKYEVLFPVFIPNRGSFEWLDWFLTRNPQYTELSERMVIEWATRSGVWRSTVGTGSKDRPEMSSGVACLDDGSVKTILQSAAALQKRNFVVMEVKSNLVKDERVQNLRQFCRPHYRRIAKVMIGEPSEAYKQSVFSETLRLKQEKAQSEWKSRRLERARQRLLDEHQRQVDRMRLGENAFDENAQDGSFQGAVEDEPEPEVFLTEEEKEACLYRSSTTPDVATSVLNVAYKTFSIPGETEGFESVVYDWAPPDVAQIELQQWLTMMKRTSLVENLQPSQWFKERLESWKKDVTTWQAKFAERQEPAKRVARMQKTVEGLAKVGVEQQLSPEEDLKSLQELAQQESDVFSVEDILNVGENEPLFADFTMEDWAMTGLRFELSLLANSFKRDVNEEGRDGFPIEHLQFYYNKYFHKALVPRAFGVERVEDIVSMLTDTVVVHDGLVESLVPETIEDNDIFVKLAEESRRERLERYDMGDENARLPFVVRPPAPDLGRPAFGNTKPPVMHPPPMPPHMEPPPHHPQQIPPPHLLNPSAAAATAASAIAGNSPVAWAQQASPQLQQALRLQQLQQQQAAAATATGSAQHWGGQNNMYAMAQQAMLIQQQMAYIQQMRSMGTG